MTAPTSPARRRRSRERHPGEYWLPLRRRHGSRGQSVVEFTVILPMFFFLLIAPIELGFMYLHYIGLEYATRAGARVGAGLATGNQNALTWPTVCQTVDNQIIASVQRTLEDRGSLVNMAAISSIQIYKAQTNGNPTANKINTWTYTGLETGPTVDGHRLAFTGPVTPAWNACTRSNANPPESLGVSITYAYHLSSPLDRLYGVFGSDTVTMSDRTVMVLNP